MDSNSPLILATENEQTKISSFAKNMNNDLSVNEILHGNLERFFSSSTIQSNSEYQILLRSIITNPIFSTFIQQYLSNHSNKSIKDYSRVQYESRNLLRHCFNLVLDDLISKKLINKDIINEKTVLLIEKTLSLVPYNTRELDKAEAETHASFDVRSDARGVEADIDVQAEAEAEAETHASFDVRSDARGVEADIDVQAEAEAEAETHASFDVRSDARGVEADIDVQAEAEAEAETHASFDVRSDGTLSQTMSPKKETYDNSIMELSIASDLALLIQHLGLTRSSKSI